LPDFWQIKENGIFAKSAPLIELIVRREILVADIAAMLTSVVSEPPDLFIHPQLGGDVNPERVQTVGLAAVHAEIHPDLFKFVNAPDVVVIFAL